MDGKKVQEIINNAARDVELLTERLCFQRLVHVVRLTITTFAGDLVKFTDMGFQRAAHDRDDTITQQTQESSNPATRPKVDEKQFQALTTSKAPTKAEIQELQQLHYHFEAHRVKGTVTGSGLQDDWAYFNGVSLG